jgi:hypothetical protein
MKRVGFDDWTRKGDVTFVPILLAEETRRMVYDGINASWLHILRLYTTCVSHHGTIYDDL